MRTQLGLCLACVATGMLSAEVPERDTLRMLEQVPLRFEPAASETPGHFVARGPRHQFSFQGNQATFQTGKKTVKLQFEGARSPQIEGIDRLRSTTSLFRGNDRSKWRAGIANYGRLRPPELYPGVDLVYYGNAGELEYDFIVKPGADPKQLRLRFDGARPRIDRGGNLVAGFVQKRPVSYQVAANGSRVPVESRYRKNADGTFGFVLGAYDSRRELVIDPALTFSAFLAGSGQDTVAGIGQDAAGFLYVAGSTYSTDLSLPSDAAQNANKGNIDAFLVKIDPKASPGAQIVYVTYFGGTNNDTVNAMTVTARGMVYLTGATASTDMPLTNGAQLTSGGNYDAFVVWLDPSQAGVAALVYSSLLGGADVDVANGIAVDAAGRIFITGSTLSNNFPTVGPSQSILVGFQDAFVAGFDPSLAERATLIFSTYLGGSSTDFARGIAAAPDGTVWVVGGTFSSTDFPVTGFSYLPTYQGGGDAFAARFNPAGGEGALVYATYLGGTGLDEASKVTIRQNGHLLITGVTLSADLPVTEGAMQSTYAGEADAFIAILNPASTDPSRASQLVYGTFFGGSGGDVGHDIQEDAAGNLYVTGYTLSSDLPVTAGALLPGGRRGLNAFVVKLNPARAGADARSYSSYIASGGIQVGAGLVVDPAGTVYVSGYTSGRIFDLVGGAAKTTSPGNIDGFVIGFTTQ